MYNHPYGVLMRYDHPDGAGVPSIFSEASLFVMEGTPDIYIRKKRALLFFFFFVLIVNYDQHPEGFTSR